MASLLQQEAEAARNAPNLGRQAFSFFAHTVLGLGTWIALMTLGYAVNAENVPQSLILLVSLTIPLCAGFVINHFRQDEMAGLVWLLGVIWFMVLALWIVDMPTAPNQCFQCGLSEKLTRTFFSVPSPSGLIDDDGPFLGTWPAVALVGYSLGARFALRRRKRKG